MVSDADSIVAAIEAVLHGSPVTRRPQPWLTWLTVALCRQRDRQSWLVRVANDHLADVDGEEGEVPGLSGWSFSFHGRGLCLSGPGSELLDVDFYGDDGATIDPYFFAERVRQLYPRPFVERQLDHWFPTPELIVRALDDLRAAGVIEHPESKHVFRLCDRLERLHPAVAAVDFGDHGTARFWANQLGDGATNPDGFHTWFSSLLEQREKVYHLLDAAEALLPRDDLIELCERLLAGPVDAALGKAVETLHRFDDHSTAVKPLLARFDPSAHHPYPVWAVARYLLSRGVARAQALDAVERFGSVDRVTGFRGNPYLDRLAMLMLEHAPDRALPLIRRALRSGGPAVVQTMAALLAVIDQTWCHRELASALDDDALADAPHLRRYLAAALTRSDSDVAQRRGKIKRPPEPTREPNAVGYTFDEVMAANLGPMFDAAIDEVRPLAAQLRNQLPNDFGAA